MAGRGDGNHKIGKQEGKIVAVDEDAKTWDELTPNQQEDVLAILNRQGFSSLEEFFAHAHKRPTRTFMAVIEKCPHTGLFMGSIPGLPGAHTDAKTLDELGKNLQEVIELLLEDGEPLMESEFVGTLSVVVPVKD